MLEKTFQPADIEPRITAAWEAADAFRAGAGAKPGAEPYSIVIPPPNVTGSLHMGHALNNTLQDILVRFERMRGRDVLWQPGMDHAGIATQMVVERKLAGENKTDRRTMGREAFLAEVWTWKAESGGQIINQLKRLGASCDWSRERFTMDEGLSKAVTKVFVELYNKGLIYKDKRLVNWDPKFQTAISDLEVVQIEKRGSLEWRSGDPEAPFHAAALAKVLAKDPSGHMYHFRYPLADGVTYAHPISFDSDDKPTEFETRNYIVVATTRPETMLGDTGVAVHPEDARYESLVSKQVELPLVGRRIPIVADEYSDPTKGTGAVKITPAHDFNDFEVGKRHGLEQRNVLDAFGKLTDDVPDTYRGLDRFEARVRVVTDLDKLGLLEKIEPTTHTVPHGDRSGVVIEPWLTDQWYVNAAELAKDAIRAVEDGRTRFAPENWSKTYFEWMRNIQPWCISRQLWWGHQIPAWYGPDGHIFVAADEAEAEALATKHYAASPQRNPSSLEGEVRRGGIPTAAVLDSPPPGLPHKGGGEVVLRRDDDVLDTWFSSALWPFSTLGWPEETPELARYYPTSVLVTGFDIIFFWVARMLMMGLHLRDEVPFRDVYIHALVRDEKGQKMSKSKGNVMDPLGLIDEYGADALRFTLAAMAAQGRDIKLSTQRVEGYRNFATKLWNASRFAEMNGCAVVPGFDPAAVRGTINRWIVGETARATASITAAIEGYRFNEAATAAYEFVWGEVCDWYVELSKPVLSGDDGLAKNETRATVAWVLDQCCTLLHPFMPFITEELWANKAGNTARDNLLCLSPWPQLAELGDDATIGEISWLIHLISEIRSIRTEMSVPASAKIPLAFVGGDKGLRARADRHADTIRRLARIDEITFVKSAPANAALIVAGATTAALPLAGIIDMDAERRRLEKEIEAARSDIAKMDAKLDNPNFMSRAKPEAIEEAQDRKAELAAAIERFASALKRLAPTEA